MKTIVKLIFLFILLLPVQTSLSAQCKTFTKTDCKPKLSPYTYNYRYQSAMIKPGDTARFTFTFYSACDYRVLICAEEESLGKVKFRILDSRGNEVFSNANRNNIDHWDTQSSTNQQFIVEVSAPKPNTSKTVKRGCVSVLVASLYKP